jgi:GT2 family glycosyltransferase
MDVSIIVVSYNTEALLKQCLESVFARTLDIEFEIIVIDNASSDGSRRMVKEVFPGVILIENQKNLGFGQANNLGFKYAKGRNVFLLNSDTILLNNAVKILSDYLDDNLQTGICGGNLFDENENPAHSFMRCLPSLFLELNSLFRNNRLFRIRYGKNLQFNYTNNPLEVGYITGADMMLRTSILNTVGGFDPDFFMYYEETELTYRIKRLGFSIYNVPNARIIHLGGKSFSNNNEKKKLFLNSEDLYYRKTHSWLGKKIIYFIKTLTRFASTLIETYKKFLREK